MLISRHLPALLVMSACAAGLGCAAHHLEPRLTDVAFSAQPVRPLEAPQVRATRFAVGDDAVSLWLEFADVLDTHTLRVRWHDPLGRVSGDTGPIALNTEGGYRPRAGVVARLPLSGAPASLLPGTWTAEVLWDDRPLVGRSFEIEAAP